MRSYQVDMCNGPILKKLIVFYYYVFLKEELFDRDYEEIKSIFDNIINSCNSGNIESLSKLFKRF